MKNILAVLALSALTACATVTQNAVTSYPAAEPVMAALDTSGFRLFELERKRAGQADNIFVSPLSVQQAMGLAHAGARGVTAQEIERAFGLGPGSQTDSALAAQREAVTRNTGSVQVKLANALWLSKDITFRPEYVTKARSSYAATSERLDFAGAPQAAADRINGWASDSTNGLIRAIVDPFGFNDQTVALLSNAVFFEGQWSEAFDQAYSQPFLFGSGKEAPFPLMDSRSNYSYAELKGWKAVRLPYRSSGDGSATERFVMDVFVPAKRQAGASLSATTYANLTAALGRSVPQRVKVSLPRFEIAWKRTINDTLQGMGIISAFRPGVSDFTGMVDAAGRQMAISKVLHASRLQVFETGTRAAAVTTFDIITSGARVEPVPPKIFRADQPFHLVVRDLSSNTVLFVGRIAKPEVYNGG